LRTGNGPVKIHPGRVSMNPSRRDLCLWLPALMVSSDAAAEKVALPSKVYRFEDLPVHTNGGNSFRPILGGATHGGCAIEAHETDLAPGGMPHPAHHHAHEEMFLIRGGDAGGDHRGAQLPLGPGLGGLRGLERRARDSQCRISSRAVLCAGSGKRPLGAQGLAPLRCGSKESGVPSFPAPSCSTRNTS